MRVRRERVAQQPACTHAAVTPRTDSRVQGGRPLPRALPLLPTVPHATLLDDTHHVSHNFWRKFLKFNKDILSGRQTNKEANKQTFTIPIIFALMEN